jgi:hypothetical protein
MTKTHLQVLALAAVLGMVGVVSVVARADSETTAATLKEITNYRQWTRVPGQPLPIEFPSAGG